jgi:hypothetical protein
MRTETSFHYWNGREARKAGTPRDHGAAFRDRLRRRAWLQGWEDEDLIIARAAKAARTPEIIREHDEARQWFEKEFSAWKQEIEANP